MCVTSPVVISLPFLCSSWQKGYFHSSPWLDHICTASCWPHVYWIHNYTSALSCLTLNFHIPPLLSRIIRAHRVHIHKHTPRPMVVCTARGSGSSIKGMFAEWMWVLNCIRLNPSGLSLSSKAKQAVLQSHYTGRGKETQTTCFCYTYPHASTKTKSKEGMWSKGLSKGPVGQSLVKHYAKYSFLMCTFSYFQCCIFTSMSMITQCNTSQSDCSKSLSMAPPPIILASTFRT